MTRSLMLDSGAFTVWSQGETILLEDYLSFCHDFPGCSYFVNLDVIPGKMNDKRSLNKDSIEASCKQGWQNYRSMIEELPKERVIPVYHQNDPLKWLDKYLSFGVPYIGISPANDCTTLEKIRWLGTLLPYLFDHATKKPLVKTHGFAVTSYDLMNFWQWHSVDSASWKLAGAWGAMYFPHERSGEWDFTRPPKSIAMSPMSPAFAKAHHFSHFENMTPGIKARVLAFLEFAGVPLGKFKIVDKKVGYKLDREKEEIWYDKEKWRVLRPEEKGVVTAVEERLRVNARFMKEANKVLPIDHIYFAGAQMPYPLEYKLGHRLLSYFHTQGKGGRRCLRKHIKLIQKKETA